jgi:hypothetical protein
LIAETAVALRDNVNKMAEEELTDQQLELLERGAPHFVELIKSLAQGEGVKRSGA